MSWADRFRSTLDQPDRVVSPSHDFRNDATTEGVMFGDRSSKTPFPAMPGDLWILVCRFLSYGEVCNLKLVCRALWRLGNSEFIWKQQIQHLADEIRSARGDDSVDQLLLQRVQHYPSYPERFRKLKRFFARDIQREFHFRELLTTHTLTSPVQFELQTLDTSTQQRRILKSEITLFRHIGPRKATSILSSCDTLAVGANSKFIEETTDREEGDFLAQLLLGLSPMTTASLFHSLGPRVRLLEVSRGEVHEILSLQLPTSAAEYATQVFEDFAVLPDTRCFVGPELCREGCVGFVALDGVRIICVVARES